MPSKSNAWTPLSPCRSPPSSSTGRDAARADLPRGGRTFEWAQLERLGEEVIRLAFRRDLAQLYVTALDRDSLMTRVMSKVLADVNVLCQLPAADSEDVI